jgi:hypothetical protein
LEAIDCLLFLIAADCEITKMSRTIIKKEDILSGLSVCQHFSKITHAVIIVIFFRSYRFPGVSYFCNLSCIICPDIYGGRNAEYTGYAKRKIPSARPPQAPSKPGTGSAD